MSFQLRVITKFSLKSLSIFLLIFTCFLSLVVYTYSTGFLDAYLIRQGLRYALNEKYASTRVTGFFLLSLSLPAFLSLRQKYLCRPRINFRLSISEKVFASSFVSGLLVNILFISNQHLSTRLSRPFEFITLLFMLVAVLNRCSDKPSRIILSFVIFLLLYASWTIKYIS